MNGEHGENHDRNAIEKILGFVAFFAVFCAAQWAGWALAGLLFRYTGYPAPALAHIIAAFIGILIMVVVTGIFMRTAGRKRHMQYYEIHTKWTDAMEQIAQGNFDVLTDPEDRKIHDELTDAFRDMARKLGDLEMMRQDFISNVSHEIQSPLTSIGGFAALLKNDALPADERRRYAEIIEAESRRLSSLSDNLLKLTALEKSQKPLDKREYRLDKQLEQVALTLEPQWAAKDISLEADLQKLSICADVDLLSQVWINILHNAIKFTPEGGRIDITLEARGDSATVRISDTGAGIGKDDLPHIFERFYKADKSRDRSLGGNGLGLSLVKKIVELHGGSIAVDSELGKGTSMAVTLPLSE